MSNPLDFDPIIEARRQWAANGWEDACDGMAAITSVVRAQQLFLGRIDTVLRPLELTFARYEVLMLLLFSRRGSLPLNKIGARLQVHPTSVTNAVDRLEEQDLIKRVPHSSDRRTTSIASEELSPCTAPFDWPRCPDRPRARRNPGRRC